MAFVGAIALAAGLAFGLGGRETAGEIVRNWYNKAQMNKEIIAQAGQNLKDRAAENAGKFDERSAKPRPANRRHESEGG